MKCNFHNNVKMSLSACDEGMLPGRTSSDTESHVSFLRERVVSELSQVLRSQVLVRVSCHRILTCQQKKELLHPSERHWPYKVNMNDIQNQFNFHHFFNFSLEKCAPMTHGEWDEVNRVHFDFMLALRMNGRPHTNPTIPQQSLAHFPNSFTAADSCSFCLDYIILRQEM